MTEFDALYTADFCHHEAVKGLMVIPNTTLKRKNVGERYLADKVAVDNGISGVTYNYKTGKPKTDASGDTVYEKVKVGQIYTVRQYTNADGKREYH